jgi:hypothetical protein
MNKSASWIQIRSNEPEFQQFVKAASPSEAVTNATAQCQDGSDGFSEVKFSAFKNSYLEFFRLQLGLPASASVSQ